MKEITTDKVIQLESMKNMTIDQIVDLYKRGYVIDDSSQIEGLPDSPELRRHAFMNIDVPNYPIPPEIYERWDRQKRYGFAENGSLYFPSGGSVIDDSSQIEGLPDSPETSERDSDVPNYPISPDIYERWDRQKYGFTGNESLYFPNDSPWIYDRESKYGFSGDIPIPPAIQERFERQRKYGFTGQESQPIQSLQEVSVSNGALLLVGIGVLAYLYMKKK